MGPRLRVDAGGAQGALQVVERRHQLPGQPGLTAPLGLLRLARGALAVVLEVGAGALGDLQVLVALALDVGKQSIEIGIDRGGGLALALGRVLAAIRRILLRGPLGRLPALGLPAGALLVGIGYDLSSSTTSASTTSSSASAGPPSAEAPSPPAGCAAACCSAAAW